MMMQLFRILFACQCQNERRVTVGARGTYPTLRDALACEFGRFRLGGDRLRIIALPDAPVTYGPVDLRPFEGCRSLLAVEGFVFVGANISFDQHGHPIQSPSVHVDAYFDESISPLP